MRRYAPLVTLLLPMFALVVPPARAAEPVAGPPPKIATFDLGLVYEANPRIKEGQKRLDVKHGVEKKDVDRLKTEARLLRDEMKDSPLSRSSPEFRQLAVRAQRKEIELQQKGVLLASKLQKDQSLLLGVFFLDLQRAVKDLAKENDYDLIFQVQTPDPTAPPKQLVRQMNQTALFHASGRFDVTKALIAKIESYHAKE